MLQVASFGDFSKTYKQLLENQLKESVNRLVAPSKIKESMMYSLKAGGKRIRPLLLFATIDAFRQNPKKGLLAAASLEMVHTYSLIHDDLPSMDNDDLRRGIPTNHKVYGEAFAILAGDALLTYSFQLITQIPSEEASAETKLKIIEELSKGSGAEGMVGGQVADIQGEGRQLSLQELEYIHIHKTGKLLISSVTIGALLAGASEEQINKLTEFAFHLGLAFQIRDDILDIVGEQDVLGKPVGSDVGNHKSTYPALLTLDGANKALEREIELAKKNLLESGLNTRLLEEITDLVANRNS